LISRNSKKYSSAKFRAAAITTMPLTNPKRLTGYADAQQYARGNSYSDAFDSIENDVAEYDDEEDEEEEEQEEEEVEEDDASSLTSELSIPDSNIDFSLVYALHTFVATVEGQASVVKGDALTLLDDSNSYWWLIKVLKTSEVGYIPAENIEVPKIMFHMNLKHY
jgi:SH3 domain